MGNNAQYIIEQHRQQKIGQINMSNDGTLMKIIEYNGAGDVLVEFQDSLAYKVKVHYSNFKKGTVTNPGNRIMYGRGYVGQGNYTITKNKKATKAGDAWRRMFDRCYSEKYLAKDITYLGCEVCEEWYDFQNFAKWFYDNIYQVEDYAMEVDKDWLVVGNKIYCPENCCIVPQIINTCISCHDKLVHFDLPIGVNPTQYNSYAARCSVEGKRITIGYYKNPYDAGEAYWKFKINYIQELANKYKDQIPENLYTAMIEYKTTYKERHKQYMKGDKNNGK